MSRNDQRVAVKLAAIILPSALALAGCRDYETPTDRSNPLACPADWDSHEAANSGANVNDVLPSHAGSPPGAARTLGGVAGGAPGTVFPGTTGTGSTGSGLSGSAYPGGFVNGAGPR